ncbi:MAG TPA: EamA family transporter [Lachnospiraceae bacterium]|nr:EamA family transporter [Lachnospiraceae bacterium]
MTWMILVLIYGVCKGVREIVKKKSLEKNTIIEVLFFYTFLSFIMVVPDIKNAWGVDAKYLLWISLKSFIIFLAWMCSFKAIEKLPISFYGILDLSRVLFATILGVFVLGEVLLLFQKMGLVLVLTGLLMLKRKKKGNHREDENIELRYIILALCSCMLNAVSGLMDKILMKDVTSSQLQFWYMLFLVSFYMIYIIITKTKIRWNLVWRNHWIWILSVLFVAADRALFVANGMEGSRVTIMTLIKQSSCIVTILAGKYIFKEKNIGYKLICAAIIVSGILVAVI